MINRFTSISAALLFSLATVPGASAQVPDSCREVRIGSGGWTDNTVQDALVMNVLEGLGYQPTEQVLGLNVLFQSLKNGDLDVHFDYWSPSSDSLVQPYVEEGSIEVVRANLTGTTYTLAVPKYAWDVGLKDFSDIAEFQNRLNGRIYGQAPGSDSNTIVLSMIDEDTFGLGDFELIESSEQGMLSQVERAIRSEDFIVFVGWSPHPMNSKYDIEYLSGGDDHFGPNYGSATIYTVTTAGLSERCPNLGRLLENVEFTVDMENTLMFEILDEGAEPMAAAKEWLNSHPDVVEKWLEGVTTIEGEPGLPEVSAHLEE